MDAAAAYPHAWCRQAHTRDGTPYFIRPIRPDDAERERRFIAGLSPDSLHNRFLGGLREPSPAFIHRLVDVDYDRTMAFVAVVGEGDDERIIGVARYAANPSSSVPSGTWTWRERRSCRSAWSMIQSSSNRRNR